jgi:hypothetical protein
LLAEWDEMKKLYRGPYIDAFCQVWFHLAQIKLLHLVPFGQQTWPLLLKIEHMVKLHVFGNNSKTVNNIRNLTWVKMISTARSNYPEI